MSTSSEGQPPVVETKAKGLDQVDLTGRALRLRIRQQEILSELGVLALQGAKLEDLLNGVGLPTDFAVRGAKSLGTRIVRAFASQLGAEFSVDARKPGTQFKLVVPLQTPG